MARRKGGFGLTLNPFGSGGGDLGRYSIGGTTGGGDDLAAYEAYAAEIAWNNGTITDEQYLAALRKLLESTTPETRDRISAQNRLDDALYTIERNKLVRAVNDADEHPERRTAITALLAFEEQRLGRMSADNEQRREQEDRIEGLRSELRQSRYAEAVERVNEGKGTTKELLGLAQALAREAGEDKDAADWERAVRELTDRVADEDLADAYQDYEHGRLTGPKLLAKLDARLAALTPGSPQYREMVRQREDLAVRVRDEERARRNATVAGARAAGKLTDEQYLAHLRQAYEETEPGSYDRIVAGNNLREAAYSLAEDKLRFEVQTGKKPPSALIRFYQGYLATMNPGSERARALKLAIRSLQQRGSGGGGGGGGGSSSKLSFGKLVPGLSSLTSVIAANQAPPDFDKLLRVDVRSTPSWRWWSNNHRSLRDAYQEGKSSWTYFDTKGTAYTVPLTPELMSEFDDLNMRYTRAGVDNAQTPSQRQTWIGRHITAIDGFEARQGQMTMDRYEREWDLLSREKERALARGDYAAYFNLTAGQADLVRSVAGIERGAPTDLAFATNTLLTGDMREQLLRDLDSIAPAITDPNDPDFDSANTEGDWLLGLMKRYVPRDTDGDGVVDTVSIDPNEGFVTQNTQTGAIEFVRIDRGNPEHFTSYVDENGQEHIVPRYMGSAEAINPETGEPYVKPTTLPAVVRFDGQDSVVRQAVVPTSAGAGLTAWGYDYGATLGAAALSAAGTPTNVVAPSLRPLERVPVQTITTVESGRPVVWYTLDGVQWIRATAEGVPPRVVLNPGVRYDATEGKWFSGTEEIDLSDPTTISRYAHFYGTDARFRGTEKGLGSPGVFLVVRKTDPTTPLDTRPDWMVRPPSEVRANQRAAGKRIANQKGLTFAGQAREGLEPESDDVRFVPRTGLSLADEARAAFAEVQARRRGEIGAREDREAVLIARRREDEREANRIRTIARSGELLPRAVRPNAVSAGALLALTNKNLGLKPPPRPALPAYLPPLSKPSVTVNSPAFNFELKALEPLKLPNTQGAKAQGGKDDVATPAPKPKPAPVSTTYTTAGNTKNR